MFIKWTLLFIGVWGLCFARVPIEKFNFSQIITPQNKFNQFALNPFPSYFQRNLNRSNSLNFKILQNKEVKDFVERLKYPKQIIRKYVYKFFSQKQSKFKVSNTSSWALGPEGGVITSYFLANSFELLGKTSKNFISTKISLPNSPIIANEAPKDLFLQHSTTDIGFGLGVRSKTLKMNLSLKAFYDFHIIDDLNTLVKIAKFKNKAIISFEDLYFHGLSGILRFDF